MKKIIVLSLGLLGNLLLAQKAIDYVDPFIGTSNFGATNPGAIAPRGMLSISPFNVAFDTTGIKNPLEKDSRWLSNPYVHENTFFTGFTHVNLSGVGCPDLGVIIAMPTTGDLELNHLKYGSTYHDEKAKPGYYALTLDKYNIKAEATADTRVGITRYIFPAGQANLIINLGLGLTNEQGAVIKMNNNQEFQGMRMVGSFCYNNAEGAYPVYFYGKVSIPAEEFGSYKVADNYQGVEAQWMTYNGQTLLKPSFTNEVIGDSIGGFFSYNFKKPTQLELKIGVSYVSIENAKENLMKEIGQKDFNQVVAQTQNAWEDKLSVAEVEGGTLDQKKIFYTGLYHALIHPNILNDINGEFPLHKRVGIKKTNHQRYTVFSLWDTYRNYHSLLSLLYPQDQLDMVNTMLDIYDETGWLPKWELNNTETFTMVGDPATVVLADTYMRGITGFDKKKAYEAMLKGATQMKDNPLRPGIDDYWKYGYVSLNSGVPGPVSTTQEYNIADFAISQFAKVMGDKENQKKFDTQSKTYRKLYDKKWSLLVPKYRNGEWLKDFNPEKGANFEANEGYIEGNAYQYTFMVPQDIRGLIKLMGGNKNFVKNLDAVFEKGQFDMANEPDIAYPYLYNYIKGSEWKTQMRVNDLLNKYFTTQPAGLPGNDDTGVMSAWAMMSMMGFYPTEPAVANYALTAPKFTKIKLRLNPKFFGNDAVEIISNASPENIYIQQIKIDGKKHNSYFITDKELKSAKKIEFILGNQPKK
ncbi:GH92 family glycosyl hydrolase [Ornithobacterium rhinotracheale]|uniref:GH92 family glycosyl hydrolase n=1 Tax=Ornithobacterium rhinotracheale TaxID=28251 RepID=UPI003FA4CC7D